MTKARMILWGIVLVGVMLRVGLAGVKVFSFPDSYDYVELGRSLAVGGAYIVDGAVAGRMPGYPIFLAGVFALGGGVTAAMVVQGLLGGVSIVLAFVLGKRWGEVVGLVAAGLVAVDPLTVAFSAAVLTESLFTLVMLGALWAGLRAMEGGRLGWWVLMGALWGAGVYLRASALYMIVPLVGVVWWGGRGKISAWWRSVGAVSAVLVFAVLLGPWVGRNVLKFHVGPLVLTSLEGISLYESVYPDADGGPRQHLLRAPASMQGMNEMQRSAAWSKLAWGHVWEDPWRVGKLAFAKVGRTWNVRFHAEEMRDWRVQAGSAAWHVPLFLLGMWGVAAACRVRIGRNAAALLLLPVAYFTLVHALYLGSVRYRVPLMPLVCIFAAVGALDLWGRLRRNSRADEKRV